MFLDDNLLRTDAFELWSEENSWVARRLNHSITRKLEINPEYSLEGLMLKLQYFGHLMWTVDFIGKDPNAGKDWGQEKGTTEDEVAGWHHQLDGHGFG